MLICFRSLFLISMATLFLLASFSSLCLYKLYIFSLSSLYSDEGLTSETSVFLFYGVEFTFLLPNCFFRNTDAALTSLPLVIFLFRSFTAIIVSFQMPNLTKLLRKDMVCFSHSYCNDEDRDDKNLWQWHWWQWNNDSC